MLKTIAIVAVVLIAGKGAAYAWEGNSKVGQGRVFMDMDGMVGKQFETGLANLKTLTEK